MLELLKLIFTFCMNEMGKEKKARVFSVGRVFQAVCIGSSILLNAALIYKVVVLADQVGVYQMGTDAALKRCEGVLKNMALLMASQCTK